MSKSSTRPGRTGTTRAPVRRTFPWGAAMGGGTFAVVLLAIVGYAAVNAGSAAPNPLRDADQAVSGVVVADASPSQGHKPGPLQYDRAPSWGGQHNPTWMTCQGTSYTAEVPEENAAHSMEHGAVWVTYRPDLPADQVATLRKLVDGTDYRFLSPFPRQTAPVSIQAWGRQLTTQSASDSRLASFAQQYTSGPQTPEKGATCSGGTQTSGVSDPAQ